MTGIGLMYELTSFASHTHTMNAAPMQRQGSMAASQRCLVKGKATAGWSFPTLPFFQKAQKLQKPVRPDLVEEILEITGDKQRGLASSVAEKDQVRKLVRQLQADLQEQGVETTTDKQLLSATWKLEWTSEQETLFIAKNAGFFKTSAGDIFQVIDTEARTLQNVITFPPEGAFVVDSSIQVAGPQRVLFQFTSASLLLPEGKVVKLPPFGKGWFDNVYVDDDIRIALDIRNDVLICSRDGVPRRFGVHEETDAE